MRHYCQFVKNKILIYNTAPNQNGMFLDTKIWKCHILYIQTMDGMEQFSFLKVDITQRKSIYRSKMLCSWLMVVFCRDLVLVEFILWSFVPERKFFLSLIQSPDTEYAANLHLLSQILSSIYISVGDHECIWFFVFPFSPILILQHFYVAPPVCRALLPPIINIFLRSIHDYAKNKQTELDPAITIPITSRKHNFLVCSFCREL